MMIFNRGTHNFNAPAGRSRILSANLTYPNYDIILDNFFFSNQTLREFEIFEVIMNGSTILYKSYVNAIRNAGAKLPFIKMQGYGLLELFVTITTGPADISFGIQGYYVPRT